MDSLLLDLRHAVRSLLKTPALSIVAALTIALGVGLTTQTFSVVYGAVMRDLPFDEGTVLVSLSQDIPSRGLRGQNIPYLDLIDWRSEQRAFRGLAAYMSGQSINLADEGSPPARFQGARVSAEFFDQVSATPVLGRVFTADEEIGRGERVVVISYDVWQNRYAGDPEVIGRRIQVDSRATTVVGVMAEGFHFPFAEDVWLPLELDPVDAQRGQNRYLIIGRLLEGVSPEQASAQMQAIAARIAAEFPETNEGVGVWLQSFRSVSLPEQIVALLWVMLAAVFGVLLVACFNVANLLLARSTVRSREIAIRAALGADRGRIIRQMLIESTLLAVAGGIAGIVLGYLGIEGFNGSLVGVEKPYYIDIRMDPPAVVFTIAITAFASLSAGTLPALRASGGKIHEILQDESRGSSSLRLGRFSTGLVVSEIALSCALLVAAGMMIKSLVNVNRIDLGFDPDGIFVARFGLPPAEYPDAESRWRFYDRLVEELEAEPDAITVGLTTVLPALQSGSTRFALEGVVYAAVRDRPVAYQAFVSPGYFGALGVSPSEGRAFDDRDRDGGVPSAVVNERFAEVHFPESSAVGARIQVEDGGPWLTIVGVVPDTYAGGGGRGGIGATATRLPQLFRPIAQVNVRFVNVVVRTRGEPGAFGTLARSVAARLDPGLPLYDARTMEEAIQEGTFIFKLFGTLFTIFGISALFLAGVGLYGVMAFSVGQRVQEMGIRMAMGADARTVFAMVLGKGMKQLAVGAGVGLALGAAMARPMAVVFFDVRPSDPAVYAAIVVTMGLAGLLACIVPATRATRVELVEALRPD